MTDMPASAHPEELLASYVDGTATAAESALVLRHLEACAACRDDVAAARQGLAALRSLPALDAPSIADAVLDAVASSPTPSSMPDLATVRGRRRRDRDRARRVTGWLLGGGAAAAAAALVALFVLVGGQRSAPTPSAAQRAAPLAPRPGLVARGGSYSKPQLDALTQRLAAGYSRTDFSHLALRPAASPVAGSGSAASGAPPSSPSACLAAGGAPSTQTVYLEEATVLGQPAYIGGYLEAGPNGTAAFALVAVSRSDCTPLYFGTHKAG
jgi:hypothetical protein